MKKSRFTEAQIMGVLRQAEGGMPVPKRLAGGAPHAPGMIRPFNS